MVDFVQLRQRVKEHLDRDRTVQTVEAEGATLDAAVNEASLLLNLPVRRVEYEIISRGSEGFWGVGQKDWKIRAYTQFVAVEKAAEADAEVQDAAEEAVLEEHRNGEVVVMLDREGAYIKVLPPAGTGERAKVSDATQALMNRQVDNFDYDAVIAAIKEPAGTYVRVGDFKRNPVNDASLSISIGDQEMKAFVKVRPAGPGGCDITLETYQSFLRNNGIVHGVKEDFLRSFADKPIFNEDVVVAEGDHPHNGRDAYIQYNFETDQSKVHLTEGPDGRVDFKELNIIQNVIEGQPLARKIKAENGVHGRTVTGKGLLATNGKDTALPLGKNVHVGEDGETILSNVNGQVLMVGGKINVEPVFTVQGNVNLKTGNIIFLGTVIITGNVEDGFSVKAAGNIEVNGIVEKAELDAEGDIIVHQGIAGKGAGLVKSGRSIWAKFVENTNVEAGNMVVVSESIINSQVDAYQRIICRGKKATIVGGRLRATEEINAKNIGSPTSGTETICEVGFDPTSKEKLDKLFIDKGTVEKDLEDIQLPIQTLESIKKQRKFLPENKEAELQELINRRQELIVEQENIKNEITEVQAHLASLKVRGKISASGKVYAGVKIIIRDVREDVINDYKAATFVLERDLIRVMPYEDAEDVGEMPEN